MTNYVRPEHEHQKKSKWAVSQIENTFFRIEWKCYASHLVDGTFPFFSARAANNISFSGYN